MLAVADFADTRQAVVRYLATANDPRRALSDSGSASALPPLSDKAKWRHVCTNAEVGEGAPPVAPLLSRVATLETGDVESLIFRNLEWLRESNSVSQSQLQWLFALLSQLDRSFLSPSATALLRDLLRLCQSIRDTLVSHKHKRRQKHRRVMHVCLSVYLCTCDFLTVCMCVCMCE